MSQLKKYNGCCWPEAGTDGYPVIPLFAPGLFAQRHEKAVSAGNAPVR